MGMCKECNEVFNANDMINGLCESCMPEGYLQEKEEEKSRVKEFDENKQKLLDSILVTTETFIDLPIEKRIDIASAQCVYGLNIIKDLFTGIRNIVGGRIKSIEDPLDEARQEIGIWFNEDEINDYTHLHERVLYDADMTGIKK